MEILDGQDIEAICSLHQEIIKEEGIKSNLFEALETFIDMLKSREVEAFSLLDIDLSSKCKEVKKLLNLSLKTEDEIMDEITTSYLNRKGQ